MDHNKLRTGKPPAPGTLILLEGFLNTWSGELDFDDFKTPHSTEEWLRETGLWMGKEKITEEQTRKIVRFRSELRSWILNRQHLQPLNELVSKISFNAEFSSDGVIRFHTTGDAYHMVVGALIEIISESQRNGTWDRFKCCALATCGWAFYDSTRSRTKRWCSMKTCGSRHKSRKHYKRRQLTESEK